MNKKIIIGFVVLITLTMAFLWFSSANQLPKIASNSYLKNYSNEELIKAKNEVYPKVTTKDDLINLYFSKLKEGDKNTIKLLSSPEFPFAASDTWNSEFDKFWNEYKEKSIEDIKFYDKEYTCDAVSVKIDTVNKLFCINKAGGAGAIYEKEYYTLTIPPNSIK